MRRTILTATIAATLGAAATSFAGEQGMSPFFWGDERAYVAIRAETQDDLELFALDDLNVFAEHIRLSARDANLELESPTEFEATRLSAYDIGTPNRKPIKIGGSTDDQDVTALIVTGRHGQRRPLQQWRASGNAVAAIHPDGSLDLGGIRLRLQLRGGVLRLVATMPDGQKQTVRFAP
jgi:hypothetical protein